MVVGDRIRGQAGDLRTRAAGDIRGCTLIIVSIVGRGAAAEWQRPAA